MKNIKNKVLLLLGLFGMFFCACDDADFLDKQPIDFLAPDNISSSRDIEEAVNGIYSSYISDPLEPIITDFFTDNGIQSTYIEIWNGSFNNENTFVETKWVRNYKMILRANTVLDNIDNIELSEEKYNQFKGEATFMRALAYLDLTEFYGGVPLRIRVESLAEANKPITPKNDIVDFILNELETASDLLPIEYSASDKGRATKGAALAIKARVLLYNKMYDQAAIYCQKVKDLGKYSLMDDYELLFLPEGEASNNETIFDMQFIENQSDLALSSVWNTYFLLFGSYAATRNLHDEFYSTNGLSIKDPLNTLYDPSVNPDVLSPNYIGKQEGIYDNRFTNRDPRMNSTIVVPYSVFRYTRANESPEVFIPASHGRNTPVGFKVRKHIDYSNKWEHRVSGVNPIIVRYADILLMEAEALIESGDYDETYVSNLINEVRQRASVMMPKVQDVEGTGLSQNELRQIVRHERRVEFAFEGLRFFDIKRWDIGATALTTVKGYRIESLTTSSAAYEEYDYLTATFDPSRSYLWPIPKVETDSNTEIN
ncbi:RagB/SusD family nutrient uptake outer membrane protein [Pseudalgibacter alginicilyticus]|nr:RagB/SusD family nutrient uptake outer membrane protein [Pseudalgibacter alginicilyticus]